MITTILISILFAIFSTSVMTYITIATPIGPWMGPTLAMLGILGMRCIGHFTTNNLLYAVSAGSIGGILATAFGFSFPTYYFLDPVAFDAFMQKPFLACSVMASLALAGGLLAWWLSWHIKKTLLHDQELPFPVGVLVYKIASAAHEVGNLKRLLAGALTTSVYCALQVKTWMQGYVIPAVVTVLPASRLGLLKIPAIQFSMGYLPMLWAIGFIAGSMITVPLLIGTLTRIFFTDIVQALYFSHISSADFILAFCSGMVVAGACGGLIDTPRQLFAFFSKQRSAKTSESALSVRALMLSPFFMITVAVVIGVLSYFELSFAAQAYTIFFTLVCAYQIAAIAGKIGLALLGRFATFVMLPGLVIFGFTGLQATVVATLVEACGGVTTDILFGQRAAALASLSSRRMFYFQLLGIVVSSITMAFVFWLLVTHFQLGSELLFAERGQARALLVKAVTFDYGVLALGVLYGFVLKKIKVHPMLVLGGLLMPLSLSLGLVIGGLSSLVVADQERWEPFCSGMFAANALWMVWQALW